MPIHRLLPVILTALLWIGLPASGAGAGTRKPTRAEQAAAQAQARQDADAAAVRAAAAAQVAAIRALDDDPKGPQLDTSKNRLFSA